MEDNSKIAFKEFNSKAFDEFVETDICKYVQQICSHFRALPRATTLEEQRVKSILHPDLYEKIAFAYACSEAHQTIQSAIGCIASAILQGDKEANKVLDAHQVASELIVYASNLYEAYPNNMYEAYNTINGYLKVKPLYTIEQEKKYYPLPNTMPTLSHRPLGQYKWNITETSVLDKLNNTAFTVLDIPEQEPSKDMEEKHSKWEIREKTKSMFLNKPIYFNWHPDYRGRMYSGSYHYNPQGDEYEKSIIAFAEPEKITYEGKFSVYRAIARAFGKDKLIDKEKVKWYMENKENLNPEMAKEPHIARALLLSLSKIESTGETNVMIEADATCSQKQIVAVLTKCKTTASTCNVYNPGNEYIQDAYGLVANEMSRLLEESISK